MIQVKNNKINMYEGDTGKFSVLLEGDLEAGDILEFRVKENLDDATTLLLQQYEAQNEVIVEIAQADTIRLTNDTGSDKVLKYGFKLRKVDDVDTILGVGDFVLKKGV